MLWTSQKNVYIIHFTLLKKFLYVISYIFDFDIFSHSFKLLTQYQEVSSIEFIEFISNRGGDFIGLIYVRYLLFLLLIIAVLMDFKFDRIYNGWILFGSLLGLSFHVWGNGWRGICSAAVSMLFSFSLLYPIYKIGGLGAGDVKLFIMSGSFLSVNRLLYVIFFAFLIGAMISIGKMISEGNFKERMQYLFSYLSDVLCTGQWKLYGENLKQDSRKYKSGKIHFALPICLSVMLELGGLF